MTLGNGSYAFRCLPDDADAVTGPTVRITGSTVRSGPAAVPITQQELIPPTLAYQKWIQARTVELARKTDVLRAAVDRGDLAAARKAWLPAHLVYERMGAAYGTFGDSDGAINGTTAGLAGGVHDAGFTGFHRVEYGLWHGELAERAARSRRSTRQGRPRVGEQLALPADGSVRHRAAGARDPGEHRAVRADRPHRLRQRHQPGHRPRQPRRHARTARLSEPAAEDPGPGVRRTRYLDGPCPAHPGRPRPLREVDTLGSTHPSAKGEGRRRPRWTGRAAGNVAALTDVRRTA